MLDAKIFVKRKHDVLQTTCVLISGAVTADGPFSFVNDTNMIPEQRPERECDSSSFIEDNFDELQSHDDFRSVRRRLRSVSPIAVDFHAAHAVAVSDSLLRWAFR